MLVLLVLAVTGAFAWAVFPRPAQAPIPEEPREMSREKRAYWRRLYLQDQEAAAERFYLACLRGTGDAEMSAKALEGWLYEQVCGGSDAAEIHRQELRESISRRRVARTEDE